MKARSLFGLLRVGMAIACVVALAFRLVWGLGSHTIAGENFFAYLTVQSNCAFAALLLVAGIVAFRRDEDPRWLTIGLAITLTWTITCGIAFALIVWQAGIRGIRIDVPWSDQLLHFWLPGLAIVGWTLAPGHLRVPWWVVPVAPVYPLLWGAGAMWRGPRVGWYPYYFLDLRQVGVVEFVLSAGISLALFALVATAIVLISRAQPSLDALRLRLRRRHHLQR